MRRVLLFALALTVALVTASHAQGPQPPAAPMACEERAGHLVALYEQAQADAKQWREQAIVSARMVADRDAKLAKLEAAAKAAEAKPPAKPPASAPTVAK